MLVASSPFGMGSSSPSSVMRTERRGSGRGAKRILRIGGGEGRERERWVGVVAELRLADDEDDDEGSFEDEEDGEKEYPWF